MGGSLDTCACMAESLCCPSETITTFSTSYSPIQKVKSEHPRKSHKVMDIKVPTYSCSGRCSCCGHLGIHPVCMDMGVICELRVEVLAFCFLRCTSYLAKTLQASLLPVSDMFKISNSSVNQKRGNKVIKGVYSTISEQPEHKQYTLLL